MADSPRRQTIPVLMLVRGAFRLAWQQRDDALRLGLVPTLICFAGFLYAKDAWDAVVAAASVAASDGSTSGAANLQVPADLGQTLSLAGFIVFLGLCIAATNWLRFSLIGPMSATGLGLRIGKPHFSFTLTLLAMVIIAGTASRVFSIPFAMFGMVGAIGWVAMLVAMTVAGARLMPFLVALAISQPISLKDAWAASRGNGIGLALALFATQVICTLGLLIVSQILAGVGFAQAAPIALFFIAAVANVAIAIVQSNVLAAAFRHMVGIRV